MYIIVNNIITKIIAINMNFEKISHNDIKYQIYQTKCDKNIIECYFDNFTCHKPEDIKKKIKEISEKTIEEKSKKTIEETIEETIKEISEETIEETSEELSEETSEETSKETNEKKFHYILSMNDININKYDPLFIFDGFENNVYIHTNVTLKNMLYDIAPVFLTIA